MKFLRKNSVLRKIKNFQSAKNYISPIKKISPLLQYILRFFQKIEKNALNPTPGLNLIFENFSAISPLFGYYFPTFRVVNLTVYNTNSHKSSDLRIKKKCHCRSFGTTMASFLSFCYRVRKFFFSFFSFFFIFFEYIFYISISFLIFRNLCLSNKFNIAKINNIFFVKVEFLVIS